MPYVSDFDDKPLKVAVDYPAIWQRIKDWYAKRKEYRTLRKLFIRVDGFDEFTPYETKVRHYAAVGTYLPAKATRYVVRGDTLYALTGRNIGVYVRHIWARDPQADAVVDPDGSFSVHYLTQAEADRRNKRVDPHIPR